MQTNIEGIKTPARVMLPHDMAVFAQRLKKPFFLNQAHKETVKIRLAFVSEE